MKGNDKFSDSKGLASRIRAFRYASKERQVAKPLDWLENKCSEKWSIGGEEVKYS